MEKAQILRSQLETLRGSLNRFRGQCQIKTAPEAIHSPNSLAFVYMSDWLSDDHPVRTLRSLNRGFVTVPRIRSKAADGAFSSWMCCTEVWTNLPCTSSPAAFISTELYWQHKFHSISIFLMEDFSLFFLSSNGKTSKHKFQFRANWMCIKW